jgi:hypothetical protein
MNVIKNNMIHTINAGTTNNYPIYLAPTTFSTTQFDIDANNMFAASYVGFAGAARTTIALWRQFVTTDQNSVSANPNFVNPANNLKLTNSTGFICSSVGLNTDIEGSPRGFQSTMGCYEMVVPIYLNAGLKDLIGLRQGHIFQQYDYVKVVLANTGYSTPITSVNLSWSVNGMIQGPPYNIPYTLSLNPGQDTMLIVGTITYPAGQVEVKVWINDVNGLGIDGYQLDDTISQRIPVCPGAYAGTYTVGPSSNNDFKTLEEAYAAFDMCGIAGDITLAFETGTYNRNLNFTNNSVRFGTNHLTITSVA